MRNPKADVAAFISTGLERGTVYGLAEPKEAVQRFFTSSGKTVVANHAGNP